MFFLLSATNTASSAYIKSVTLTPLNFIPSSFSKASFIINSLYRLKSKGDITQPCLTPLSTTTPLPTSPSHLTAACCSSKETASKRQQVKQETTRGSK